MVCDSVCAGAVCSSCKHNSPPALELLFEVANDFLIVRQDLRVNADAGCHIPLQRGLIESQKIKKCIERQIFDENLHDPLDEEIGSYQRTVEINAQRLF